jgi:hypothetical protein
VEMQVSLWTRITMNTILLFIILSLFVSLALSIYRKKKLTIKQFGMAIVISLLFSGFHYFYFIAYYHRSANETLAFLKDAFLNCLQINVTYYLQNPIVQKKVVLDNQEQINLIRDSIFNGNYKIAYPRGEIKVGDPTTFYFHNDIDITLTLLGYGNIEILCDGLKVRLVSNNENLYSEIENIILIRNSSDQQSK